MPKIKLNQKQKILAYVVIGIVFVFLVERLFLSGLRGRLRGIAKEIKVEEARLRKILGVQNAKDRLSLDQKNYQGYLKTKKPEDSEATAELLKEVERLAKEAGLSVVNLNPQPAGEEKTEVRQYKADLRVEANIEQVLNFLNRVQESKLLIKVDKLTLAPKDEQASLLKMEATLSMAVP